MRSIKLVVLVIISLSMAIIFSGCSKNEVVSTKKLSPQEAFMKQAKKIPAEKIPPHPDFEAQNGIAESQLVDAVSKKFGYETREYSSDIRYFVSNKSFNVNNELEEMEKFGVKTYFWAMPVVGEVAINLPSGKIERKSARILVRFYKDPTGGAHADFVPIEFGDL